MQADAVLPGMSGAPVVRVADGAVAGVVSGRYNSADVWLAGSVWVARTENLRPLLTGLAPVQVRESAVPTVDVTLQISDDRVRLTGGSVNAGDGRCGPPPADPLAPAVVRAAPVNPALDAPSVLFMTAELWPERTPPPGGEGYSVEEIGDRWNRADPAMHPLVFVTDFPTDARHALHAMARGAEQVQWLSGEALVEGGTGDGGELAGSPPALLLVDFSEMSPDRALSAGALEGVGGAQLRRFPRVGAGGGATLS